MRKSLNRRAGARLIAVAAAGALVASPIAVAAASGPSASAARTTYTNSKTYTVGAHRTLSMERSVPHALQFRGANYSCVVSVPQGVKVLSHGFALGGTVCRAKVKNNNSRSKLVKLTAKTIRP